MTPIETRFSREAPEWYDKWLDAETFHIEPPEPEDIIIRVAIIGMKHHDVPDDLRLEGPVILEHEEDNKFDRRAIKVLYNGEHIGYIPRKETAYFHDNTFRQEGDLSILPKVISGPELYVYLVGCYGR
jgi:hypothetical protein